MFRRSRRVAAWLLGLGAAALLCALPQTAWAQDGDAPPSTDPTPNQAPEEPRQVKADMRQPRKAKAVEVIGAYRPVDPARPKNPDRPSPPSQYGLDLYLAMGDEAMLRVGQVFEVFRTFNHVTAPDISMTLKVGTVEILSIQGPLAVGRVVGGPSAAAQPHLRTPGIMVGDFVRPDRPMSSPEPEATPPTPNSEEAQPNPTMVSKRRKRRRRKPKLKPEPCPKSPEEALLTDTLLAPPVLPNEARPPDPDGFKSWNAEPIDF